MPGKKKTGSSAKWKSADHTRGVWVLVCGYTPGSNYWFKHPNVTTALIHAAGFYTPVHCSVHTFDWDREIERYTALGGKKIMGIASKANKGNFGTFISASALARAEVRFTITDIREDSYEGAEQWVFDADVMNGETVTVGKVDNRGDLTGEEVSGNKFTFKLGKTTNKGVEYESRTELVQALRDHGFPYDGDNDGYGCYIKMSGRFAVIEDEAPATWNSNDNYATDDLGDLDEHPL